MSKSIDVCCPKCDEYFLSSIGLSDNCPGCHNEIVDWDFIGNQPYPVFESFSDDEIED
jgi:hypothetical protein